MKNIIHVIAMIALCISVTAQDKSYREKKGDKRYFVYAFDKAIKEYKGVKTLTLEGQRRLAKSYRNTDKIDESELAYEALAAMPGATAEDHYDYAMILKMNGKFLESSRSMDKFISQKPADLRGKDYLANKERLGPLLIDDGSYKIVKQSINSAQEDFGTSYYKNKVVFASTRTAKPFRKKDNANGKPFLDLYVADVENGQLKSPEKFAKKLNGKMHDGPASFSNNDTYMAFTRSHYKDHSADNVVELQIYFSSNTDKEGKGTWSKPEPFIYNKEGFSVQHPNLSADGNTMYFVSTAPGGFGGADIYKTTRVGQGPWSTPENMGDKINTEGNELFPYFVPSQGKLMFTSDGRFGLGGLDIFIADISAAGVEGIYNAGTPLNTRYDDYAAIMNSEMTKGYFSSDRSEGSGDDDIYAFDFLLVENVEPATVEVVEVVKELEPEPVEEIAKEEPKEPETPKVVLDPTSEIKLDKIYFDYDKFTLRPDAKKELDKIVIAMNSNPKLTIEVLAYSDCRGTSEYNQNLSNKRANEATFYIKKRIIKPERVHGKGYGETQMTNDCSCGVAKEDTNCTENEHQDNRRAKFIVTNK